MISVLRGQLYNSLLLLHRDLMLYGLYILAGLYEYYRAKNSFCGNIFMTESYPMKYVIVNVF